MKAKFFELAKKVSQDAKHHSHKIGSVLIKKNRVIAVAFNQIKTHPRSTHSFNMLHSELALLLKTSPDERKGATIYIYRELKDGRRGSSKPCSYCHSALKEAGLSKMYYTNDGYYSEEALND